jgi:hypothetical protein
MACRQQTDPPQQRRSKDATAHPHQPGARPEPPHPDPAHSSRHHPAKAEDKFPLRNRIPGSTERKMAHGETTPPLSLYTPPLSLSPPPPL